MKMMKLTMDMVLAVSFACLLAACGGGNVGVPLDDFLQSENQNAMIPTEGGGDKARIDSPAMSEANVGIPLGDFLRSENQSAMIPTEDCNCHLNPNNPNNHSTCYIKGIRATKTRENIKKRSRIEGWNLVEIKDHSRKDGSIFCPRGCIILGTGEASSYTNIVMKYRLTNRIVKYSLYDRNENKIQVEINISRDSGNADHDLLRKALSVLGCN